MSTEITCRRCGFDKDFGPHEAAEACKGCLAPLDHHEFDPPPPPFDLVARIVAYENGELDEGPMEELFQFLVDNGLAWSLQGHYGRTAAALIEAGRINPGHGQNVEAN